MNPTLKEDLLLLNDVIKIIKERLRCKIWRNENKEKIKLKDKKYYEKNKKEINIKKRKWREKPEVKVKRQIYFKKYNQKNKEKRKIYDKNYQIKNKKILNEKRNVYHRKKIKVDIQYRMAGNLRARLRMAINGNTKSGSAIDDLGCSIEFLKQYLESKFTDGMSWDNYGEWHIDHIKPLASFDLTDRKKLLEACHYTNLQPLWARDNIIKRNKLN